LTPAGTTVAEKRIWRDGGNPCCIAAALEQQRCDRRLAKDTVEFLVAHGADLTIRDAKFDSTPGGWAVEGQHDEIRELLHCA
jgi:hypothetical protein